MTLTLNLYRINLRDLGIFDDVRLEDYIQLQNDSALPPKALKLKPSSRYIAASASLIARFTRSQLAQNIQSHQEAKIAEDMSDMEDLSCVFIFSAHYVREHGLQLKKNK